MPMLVKFYQSNPENPENPENPDSDKLELKCVTSVILAKILLTDKSNFFWEGVS